MLIKYAYITITIMFNFQQNMIVFIKSIMLYSAFNKQAITFNYPQQNKNREILEKNHFNEDFPTAPPE